MFFVNDNDCCKSCCVSSLTPSMKIMISWFMVAWKPNAWTRHQLSACKMFSAFFVVTMSCWVHFVLTSRTHAIERSRRSLWWLTILGTAGVFSAEESIGFNRSTVFLRVTSPRIINKTQELIFNLDVLHAKLAFPVLVKRQRRIFFYTEVWSFPNKRF